MAVTDKKRTELYRAALALAKSHAARGVYWPMCREDIQRSLNTKTRTLNRLFEVGFPAAHLPPILNVVGGGSANTRTLDKDDPIDETYRNKIGEAFACACLPGQGIFEAIMAAALDRKHPNQATAWKLALAYGIDLPFKRLPDETIKKLAEAVMQEQLDQARERQLAAAIDVPVTGQTDQ